MHSISSPTRQIYTGRLTDKDPISSKLPLIGQMNPTIERRWRLSQGRAVAGLGAEEVSQLTEASQEDRRDDYVQNIEGEDDVFGSGIFDMSGRTGTVHPDLGVFADHPSLPGYIAREVQFAVSKDVVDPTAGAQVVVVPGGGMAYVERGGRNVGPLQTDDHLNPYVMLRGGGRTPAGHVRVADGPAESVQKSSPNGGVVVSRVTPEDVPERPSGERFSPDNAQYNTAFQQSTPIDGFGATLSYPWHGPVSDLMRLPAADRQRILAQQKRPAPARNMGLRSFSDTPAPTTSWGTYLAAGAIVGVAAAIFMGTVKMPGRRRAAR